MKGLRRSQLTHPRPAISSHRPRMLAFVALSACMLLAIVVSACSANLPTGAVSADALSSASASSSSSGVSGYPVKVYFSRYPDSLTKNFNSVYPVNRVSPTIAVATFSIQLLIAGPTLSEQQAGYFTELNTILSGPSNCTGSRPVGGPDFTITLDHRGSKPQTGTATLKFCRLALSPGIGADARITAEITATLKQFSNIKNVVILTKDGHCFGDESGKDRCLG